MDGQEVGDPGDFAGGQIVADDAVGPGEVGERGVAGGYGAEGRVGCGGEVHRPVTVVVDARDGVVGVVCDSRRCDDFEPVTGGSHRGPFYRRPESMKLFLLLLLLLLLPLL